MWGFPGIVVLAPGLVGRDDPLRHPAARTLVAAGMSRVLVLKGCTKCPRGGLAGSPVGGGRSGLAAPSPNDASRSRVDLLRNRAIQVPEPDVAVVPGRGQRAAVGREGDVPEVWPGRRGAGARGRSRRSRGRGPVAGPRRQQPPIRRERHRTDGERVAGDLPDLAAGPDIPDPDRSLAGVHRGQQAAIGRVGQGGDAARGPVRRCRGRPVARSQSRTAGPATPPRPATGHRERRPCVITGEEWPRKVIRWPPRLDVPQDDLGGAHGSTPPGSAHRARTSGRSSSGRGSPGAAPGRLRPGRTGRRRARPSRWRDDGHRARTPPPSRIRGRRGLARRPRPSTAGCSLTRPDSSTVAMVRPSGLNAKRPIGTAGIAAGPIASAGPPAGHRGRGARAVRSPPPGAGRSDRGSSGGISGRPARLRDRPASAAPGPFLKTSSSYRMAGHPSGSDDRRARRGPRRSSPGRESGPSSRVGPRPSTLAGRARLVPSSLEWCPKSAGRVGRAPHRGASPSGSPGGSGGPRLVGSRLDPLVDHPPTVSYTLRILQGLPASRPGSSRASSGPG